MAIAIVECPRPVRGFWYAYGHLPGKYEGGVVE